MAAGRSTAYRLWVFGSLLWPLVTLYICGVMFSIYAGMVAFNDVSNTFGWFLRTRCAVIYDHAV